MRYQRYLTTAVLIAVKSRKKTVTSVIESIPLRKPRMSSLRVVENGSIIGADSRVLTSVN